MRSYQQITLGATHETPDIQPRVKKRVAAYESDEVRKCIGKQFNGAIIPALPSAASRHGMQTQIARGDSGRFVFGFKL
jgi:hypothetical protein